MRSKHAAKKKDIRTLLWDKLPEIMAKEEPKTELEKNADKAAGIVASPRLL